MMNKILVLTILFFYQCSTNQTDMAYKTEVNRVVSSYVQQSSTASERQELIAEFKDVLDDWSANQVTMGIYQKYDYKIHDLVIFNQEKDKALLFSSYIKERGRGTVDLFGARYNQQEERWYFHHRGLPSFAYRFKEAYMEKHAFSDEELLARSVDKLVDDGLVKYHQVNQKYINTKWF